MPKLKAGGAEKILIFLSRSLKISNVKTTICVLGFNSKNHFDVSNLNIIYLNKERLRNAFFQLYKLIKKQQPSIVLTSIYHLNIFSGFLKIFFNKTNFIAREANIYSERKKISNKSLMPKFLEKYFYKKLDSIIFLSKEMKVDFENFFGCKFKSFIINNPITTKHNLISKSFSLDKKINFLNVGSLHEKKGHSRLISKFSFLNLDYSLKIYGEGNLKHELNLKIKKLNLVGKIKLMGLSKDLNSIYRNSNFFIQSSFVEGFPNALLEALSFGIPCLVFKAPGGHNEIIKDGFNGFFIDEKDNFVEEIEKLIIHKWDRKAIKEDIIERYSPEKTLSQYETIFKSFLDK